MITLIACFVSYGDASLFTFRPYFHPQNVRRERDRAEKSMYVRGFPADTTVEQLQELFTQYGVVENVMLNMDKTKVLCMQNYYWVCSIFQLSYPANAKLFQFWDSESV